MESPVRPYNSNSPGEPRKRSARGGKRSEASARKVSQATKVETREIEVELSPTELRLDADVAPASVHIPEADVAEAPTEPGPMITVDDFEEIFARFQTPLTNFVFRLVGNREQAYDLAQVVFVKAYRALSSGTTIQSAALSSWLYRIASNTATDALRRRRLISWLPLSLFNEDRGVGAGMPGMDNPNGQQGYSAEEHLSNATNAFSSGYDGGRFEQRVADREVVQAVLQKLPEKYASCLLLYEHEGFSCAEIADILNVSPSAVKMRLMRARERFISLYQQEVNGK
jgi:RNA polymerase sigma-70 factor, ECF subfamily